MSAPRIPWPGGRHVRHVKQLQTGSRTATTDCGVASELMVTQAASHGLWRPAREDFADIIAAYRSQMPHGPTWPATRISDWRAAMTSQFMRGLFLALGHRRPSNGNVRATHGDVVKMLREGRAVQVAIDYGRLNDLMPSLSGSPTFRKGHAIPLIGYAEQNGVAWTYLGDPLFDGRRAGIPRGWQKVRVRRYLRAAETWGVPKAGKGHAYVMWVSEAGDL